MRITYRPEIDGLRAIAVGVVIFYHAQITIFGHQPFKGGFIGVDIFFVISGYLITSIILKELVTTGVFSFKYFYQRRIRRILPALLIVMLASLPLAWIYLLPSSFIDFSKSILYSLGFSSNFYFHYSGQQYGAVSGLLKPFLHTWSLSVEEQYYILFPIFLFVAFKYFREYLIHILIITFIISLGLAEWGSRNYPSLSFYVLPTRGWELLAGSILAYFEITLGYRSKNHTFNLVMPSVGILLIGHSILFLNDEMLHPSLYTLYPIIGVCLIIWFSHKDELITKILSTKLFVGVGLISYSLYLWHYPIFAFLRNYRDVWLNTEKSHFLILKVSSIFLILILSILTYFFIERVFRNKKINFTKIFLILFFKFLLLVIFNISIVYFDGIKSRFHPFLSKYDDEHRKFELNYNYNNFDSRKNIFIVGNSYSDDLLNLFYFNEELNKKYYFYTALGDNVGENYQIECLNNFFKINMNICESRSFSFLKKQYDKSDYIILGQANFKNKFFLKSEFNEIVEFIKKDKKKIIVFLDDVSGADILDDFIKEENRTPDLNELEQLEKDFYLYSLNHEKEILKKIKNKFFSNNIKYLTRSELFCNQITKKCPLISDNEKIYFDYGHLTENGAKYFSNQAQKIINKLIN